MADSQIGVAIVGTGRISDLHAIEYLQNPAAQIVALCDRDVDLAQASAKKWGLEQVAIDQELDQCLARPEVDMVEILLPHHLHLDAALRAIDAGKIVSLQKPMAMTLDEADQIVAAAKASSKPFKVFENFIFYPPVLKAKQLVDDGAIGTPLSIRLKSNVGISKNAWEVPVAANAWRQDVAQSGGGPLVFDDGHHKFALAWDFMGEPDEVHAFVGSTKAADGSVLDAQSLISFRFPENRIGNLEVVHSPELEIDSRHYAQDDRVEITGTKGVVWVNCGHGSIGSPPPVVVYRDDEVVAYDDVESGWEHSFILSTRHFLEVLVSGQGQPRLTASQGRQVLRFALAAQESARTGETVRVGASD